jgi:predicted restriction endonuclease
MKLTNLASFDPAHKNRGVKGLSGRSHLDGEVWNEFQNNWQAMAILSEEMLERLGDTDDIGVGDQFDSENVATETKAVRKVRTMQAFFRKAVFAAYTSRCCVTGNPVPELLIASHILPWSEYPEERLNPKNGLCLAAHFDRAFDRGLISFDKDSRLLLSARLRDHLPDPALEADFVRLAGRPLQMSERFPFDPAFMEHHRRRFGFKSR